MTAGTVVPASAPEATLVDLVDRLLGKGVVVSGDVTLSVADVDLVYVNLRALVASVGTLACDPYPAARPALLAPRKPTCREEKREEPPPSLPRRRAQSAPARRPVSSFGQRIETDPERVEKGLAQLVLTIVELLRELMERQALRRIDDETLDEEQVDRLGETFMLLERRMAELKESFGLTDEDLNLNLGPLGNLV
jgi:hypothetical protein